MLLPSTLLTPVELTDLEADGSRSKTERGKGMSSYTGNADGRNSLIVDCLSVMSSEEPLLSLLSTSCHLQQHRSPFRSSNLPSPS